MLTPDSTKIEDQWFLQHEKTMLEKYRRDREYRTSKLREAKAIIDGSGREIRLEIDGGVKVDNIGEIASAGADTFVAGSAIFGSGDYAATIAAMRKEIAKAT